MLKAPILSCIKSMSRIDCYGFFLLLLFLNRFIIVFLFFFNADNIIYYSTSFDLLAVCFSYLHISDYITYYLFN